MAPLCEVQGCKLPAVELVGHVNCLCHLPCVSQESHFNSYRCSLCIIFINAKFVGATSFDALAHPRDELECLLRRLVSFIVCGTDCEFFIVETD